jgi:hypothetical protein
MNVQEHGILPLAQRLKEASMASKHQPTNQLPLLTEPAWRLDERTRQIGLEGVASAREALRRGGSGRPAPVDHHQRQAA